MKQVYEYKSPGKNKDASTINDSAYYNSDNHEDEISDLSKQVEASKEPITDTHVRNASVGIVSVKPDAVGVVIIGRGGRGITQGVISGGTRIVKDVVTDVFTDSSKMIFKTDAFLLNPFKSQKIVVTSEDESTLSSNLIFRTAPVDDAKYTVLKFFTQKVVPFKPFIVLD